VRTLKLTLAYDGTAYVGWQRQAEGVSIQGLVEAAVARIEGEAVTVTGAGRTDAGVHALGQVATLDVASTIACDAYIRALNAMLPSDVRILAVEEAPPGFHARFSARSKTYRYRMMPATVASPFEARFAWHVTHALDRSAMRAALDACVGQHDFAAFQATGTTVRETVRTIAAAHLIDAVPGSALQPDPALLIVEVTGDGFLRHMVRTLVGTLVEIGRGRWPPGEMAAILASRDRARAGPTAPPHGLFLVAVEY
jgi:tRNA pseudouridine38-40 synthase